MSGASGTSIIAAYAVVKAYEAPLSESVDVQASRAALDEQELQELEAELYGHGAGSARTTHVDPAEVERVHATRPHFGRGSG
jgi:hypothetical protein